MLRFSWTLLLLAAVLLVDSQDPAAGNTDTTPASSDSPTDTSPAGNTSSSDAGDNSTASEGGQSSPSPDSMSKMGMLLPQGGQGKTEGGDKKNDTRLPLHQAKIPATVPVKQSTVTYRLQWQDAHDNGGAISRYNIIYYPRDQLTRQKNASSVADFVDLKDLEPGEIYQAYVQAVNENGFSQPLAITFKTQSVLNSTDNSQTCLSEIVDLTASSILLAFHFQDGNDVEVDGFEVKFTRADESFEHTASVTFDRYDQIHVKGLQPATRYRFRITTRSSGRGGPGQSCGEFDTIMPEAGAPLAPKPVLGNTVTFNLQWEAPDNDSVKHYKLDYWMEPRFGEPIHHNFAIVEAPKNSHALTSLQPCRRYQVEISPRGKPKDRANRNGVSAKKQQQLPRSAHVMKVIFTTDCTIVTGSVENPGFSL